jgi:hypothetical protein
MVTKGDDGGERCYFNGKAQAGKEYEAKRHIRETRCHVEARIALEFNSTI